MLLANPFDNDPRVYNEAKTIISAGHRVTVLAWDKTKSYQKREKKEDIEIIRSYNTRLMDIMPYDIFKLHLWWNKGFNDSLDFLKENSFDVIHCHDLSSLPIGIKLKKKFGLPLIYDAHEIWGYMVEKDVPWWRYYIWKEKKLLKNVDHLIVTNNSRKKFYISKISCPVSVIDNYKNLVSNKLTKPPNDGKKKLTILYIGGFIEKRFLLELIDVVGKIDNVKLRIGGRGKLYRKIEEKVKLHKNVEFLGTVPSEKVISFTVNSDVVFCMIAPHDKNDITASTNKQFEAMVAGRPIITSNGTYSGEFTKNLEVGLSIPYSKKSLEKAIINIRDNIELRDKLGKNAFYHAIKNYNWKKQERKIVEIYKNIKTKKL